MTQKIVINCQHGGFGLSHAAFDAYCAYAGKNPAQFWDREIPRNCPVLLHVIQRLGMAESSGAHCTLRIVEIPDDVNWQIEEHDGREWVAEKHRTWE